MPGRRPRLPPSPFRLTPLSLDHATDAPPAAAARPRRSLARRLLSGAAWAFAAKVVGVTSGLAVNAFLARMLPPEEMGAYFLAVSITTFAAIVARFGLKQTIVRLVAESMAKGLPGRAGASLRIVYVITALGALVVGGGYHLAFGAWLAESVFEMPILASVTGLTALWIAVLAFQTPVAETFRGLHDIRLAVFLDGILASALLAATLGVLWLNGYKVSFAQAILLSVVVAAASLLFGTLLFLRRARDLRGEGEIRPPEVLRISGPLFVTNLANQAMTNFSLWIVAAFLTAGEVALYGAAWKLVNLVALPLMLMNMSVQPVIAELHATGDKQRLQAALRGTATLAGVPALAVLAIFIVFGADVLGAVYGSHYCDAALILAVLSVGQIANVWTGSCGQVLVFTGHQRQLMSVTLWTGTASAAMALLGVHYWGLAGAATATAGGRVLQNGAVWLMVRKLTGLWTHGTFDPRYMRLALQSAMKY